MPFATQSQRSNCSTGPDRLSSRVSRVRCTEARQISLLVSPQFALPIYPTPTLRQQVRKRHRRRPAGTASHQGSTDTHLSPLRLTKSPLRRWQHAGPTLWDAGASRSPIYNLSYKSNEMSVGYHHKVTVIPTLTSNSPFHCVLVPREVDRQVQSSCSALVWAGSRQSRRRI
ncbi:uncharacterized protein LY79DRAFT_274952 [Colletotrichum navitas]|uniref:Uncharacterized protein n=1 Tax=Colletotrichum navitas TaxID=681940 RepID=A0AAD8V416_9PEZI|nr:uncharacterized protein LY79DRAFT_274952 [Colletotrichum navitas]KAK1585264.1 hypothetical protein LY79DRAFT_274952 [Colletotrichum navitas]